MKLWTVFLLLAKKVLRISPEFKPKENIILRDYLALERTKLANERTLLSYIKTSLYLSISGIAFIQLKGFGQIRWIGFFSIFLSITFTIIGILRFFFLKKRLNRFYAINKIEQK
jgi:putative membrane protein